MTQFDPTTSLPEGYFIGRNGELVLKGQDQYIAYGVRRGKHGTRVVRTHTAMVADTAGVSGAVGKGFDRVGDAEKWCNSFIAAYNPRRIAELRAEIELLDQELASVTSVRM